MDISDQHIQQLPGGSHGASHGFLPLSYMHNLQSVDNLSSHIPNYGIMQPPLIMNSSNDITHMTKAPPAALIHCNSNSAAAPVSSNPYLMFNPGNINMGSMISGLDQIPGSYKTSFDFNQIYNDHAHIFNIAGVDPQANMHSTELNHDQQLTHQTKPLADPNSAAKPIRSGSASAAFGAQASKSGCDDVRTADSSHKIVKLEPGMDHYTPSSFTPSNISGYPSGSAGASFLHRLHVDMEPLKEEAYCDQRIGAFDHDTVASTSSSADHHHFFDFGTLPSISASDMSPSLLGSHGYSLNGMTENDTSPNSKTACRHMATAENAINTATRCKTQAAPKRRKCQQKRVVCVPATGGLDRPTGECLPSDSWAWRKYGQKPIKNSKYPRSYYKCSSVKGCTARKQVERNPSDPMMIMITYIVDHSHPALDQQQVAKTDEEDGDKQSTQLTNGSDKQISGNMISADGNDAISEESCEPISSEGNYPEENLMIKRAHNDNDHFAAVGAAEDFAGDQSVDQACDQQGVPSVVEGSLGDIENIYNTNGINHVGLLSSSSSNYLGNLKKASSEQRNKAEEDFFNQLDELPGLFGRNPGWPDADQGGININPINIDPFDLYDWP